MTHFIDRPELRPSAFFRVGSTGPKLSRNPVEWPVGSDGPAGEHAIACSATSHGHASANGHAGLDPSSASLDAEGYAANVRFVAQNTGLRSLDLHRPNGGAGMTPQQQQQMMANIAQQERQQQHQHQQQQQGQQGTPVQPAQTPQGQHVSLAALESSSHFTKKQPLRRSMSGKVRLAQENGYAATLAASLRVPSLPSLKRRRTSRPRRHKHCSTIRTWRCSSSNKRSTRPVKLSSNNSSRCSSSSSLHSNGARSSKKCSKLRGSSSSRPTDSRVISR